jgi:hypothetical protein
MLACTALATCKERTRLDWVLAAGIDLITLAWVCLLIAWLL